MRPPSSYLSRRKTALLLLSAIFSSSAAADQVPMLRGYKINSSREETVALYEQQCPADNRSHIPSSGPPKEFYCASKDGLSFLTLVMAEDRLGGIFYEYFTRDYAERIANRFFPDAPRERCMTGPLGDCIESWPQLSLEGWIDQGCFNLRSVTVAPQSRKRCWEVILKAREPKAITDDAAQ